MKQITKQTNKMVYNELNVQLKTHRFEFSKEIENDLREFSRIHKYDERKQLKESWQEWINIESNKRVIKNESDRLLSMGYKGDAVKKMFTSIRYYYMKKNLDQNPELSNQEKVKLMAERWNKAKEDEDVMQRFKNLAEQDKKRAAKDKENYVPSADASDDEKPKKKGKRSKTGYMLFCNKERENVKSEGFTGKDVTIELARRWKALKEEDEDMYTEYMEKASELKKKKSEESDDEEEEKPKKAAPKKAAPKKKAVPKTAAAKKKVVEESDSDSSSDEE
jgi:hypothetical protein